MSNLQRKMIFTRFLYYKPGVYASLIKAIEEGHIEKSIFWGYELYMSGFEEEVFAFLYDKIAGVFGEKSNFAIFALKKKKEWMKKPDPLFLATVIKSYIRELGKKKNPGSTHNEVEPKRFISAKKQDIEPYLKTLQEIESNKYPHYRKISHYCIYHIESIYMTNEEETQILEAFRNDWLRYAVKSPIWKKRIEDFKAIVLYDGFIQFPDDDSYENFLKIYGYETDEQKVDIYKKCLGIHVEKLC
jgi:hypothetical protein